MFGTSRFIQGILPGALDLEIDDFLLAMLFLLA
jgi:hypothetical protein